MLSILLAYVAQVLLAVATKVLYVSPLLVPSAVIVLSWYYQKNKRKWELAAKMPGPKVKNCIVGNLDLFDISDPHGVFLALTKITAEYKPMARFYVGQELVIMITGAKEVEAILSSQKLLDKADDYRFIANWVGNGLLLSTGEKWHSRRKVITPTFHFSILEQFVEVFDTQSAVMADKLKKYAENGETIDIYPFVTLCALDIICETAMGTSIDAQKNEGSAYVQAVKLNCELFIKRFFSSWKRYDILFRFSNEYNLEKKSIKTLHGHTNKVISARRDEILRTRAQGKEESDVDGIGRKKKIAFLDLLLQATINGKPLTDEDIREEVDTFMFEGHDTTTSGISFALWTLAEHPEVQEKLFQEIKEIFGVDRDRAATHRDLQEMKYLDLVVKEVLRTHPPVPLIGRRFKHEVDINGWTIPANTNVTLDVYSMNHDPDVFPDPERFDPERFSQENITAAGRNPYAYVPFSAGPRNCIGQKFAQLEMKSTISKMIRRFELVSAGHKPELSYQLVLKSMNGVKLKLKPRKYE